MVNRGWESHIVRWDFSVMNRDHIGRFYKFPSKIVIDQILQIFGWHFGTNDDLINSF